MALAGELFVRIKAVTTGVPQEAAKAGAQAGREFQRGWERTSKNTFKNTEREMNSMARGAAAGSGALSHLGRSLAFASTAFIGTASAVHVLRESIDEATDAQKQLERQTALFGPAAKSLDDFAKGAANSLGLARDEALKFTNDVGQMLVPLGVAPVRAAEMSKSLVSLAANLAAMRHEDPSTVLQKIEVGLRGRGMFLKQYGIILNDTVLKEEALRLGLIKQTSDTGKIELARHALQRATAELAKAQKDYGAGTTQVSKAQDAVTIAQNKLNKAVAGSVPALDASQKAVAAANIIMQQGSRYQGEFTKHSSDLANVQKRLHAEIKNVEEELGMALLPSISRITKSMADWLGQAKNQERVQHDISAAVKTATDVIKTLWDVVSTGVKVIKPVVDAIGGLKTTLELLIALKMASWFAGMLGGFTMIAGDAAKGTGAAGAAAQVGTLQGRLLALSKMAALTIGITLLIKSQGDKGAKAILEGVVGGALAGGAIGGPVGAVAGALAVPAFTAGKALGQAVGGAIRGKQFDPSTENKTTTIDIKPGSPLHAPEDGSVVHVGSSGRVGGQFVFQLVFNGKSGAAYTFNNITTPTSTGAKKKGEILGHAPPGGKVIFHYAHPEQTHVPDASGGAAAQSTPDPGIGGRDTHGARLLSAFPPGERGANLDFTAKRGTTVGAPEPGVIHRISGKPVSGVVDTGGGYGWSVYLLADSGNYYYMTHFMRLLVHLNQRVARGTALGVVAGNVRGDHIHIEMAGAGFHVPGSNVTVPGAGATPATTPVPTGTADTSGGGALTVGEKAPKSTATIDIIGTRLENQLRAGQRAIDVAGRTGGGALVSAIDAMIALEDKVLAKARVAAKKSGEIGKAGRQLVQDTLDAITNLQTDRGQAIATAAKAKAAEAKHDELADTYVRALVPDFTQLPSSARNRIEAWARKFTDAVLTARTKALATAAEKLKALVVQAKSQAAEETDVIGTLMGLDPRTIITSEDKYGRAVTQTIGQVVAMAKAALARLKTAIAARDPAAITAAEAGWTAIMDGITGAIQSGGDAAAQAAQAAKDKIAQNLSNVQSFIMEAFDRATAAGVASIQASYQAQIDSIQQAAQAQIEAAQRAAQRRIDAINSRLAKATEALQKKLKQDIAQIERDRKLLTEQEKALAAFRAGRGAAAAGQSETDLAGAAARARIGGDPAEIEAADRALQEFLLTQTEDRLAKEADASRTQADQIAQMREDKLNEAEADAEKRLQKQAEAEIKSIQERLDAQVKAIQEAADAQVKALEAQEAAAVQEYQDQRAAERTLFEQALNDHLKAVADGKESWQDFLKWLKDHKDEMDAIGGAYGHAFAAAFNAALEAAGVPGTGGGGGDGGGGGGGGGGGSACFAAGTPIDTPTGPRAIDSLLPGDEVYCWDFDEQREVVTRVSQTFVHADQPTIVLSSDGGSLRVTAEHPIWSGGRWTPAGELLPGASLRGREKALHAVVGRVTGRRCTVYNIHVEHDDHNYFANGLLVHNKVSEFAEGGTLVGNWRGRDSQLALISPGETVISRDLTKALERIFLGPPVKGDSDLKKIARVLMASHDEYKKQTELLEKTPMVHLPQSANEIAFKASR